MNNQFLKERVEWIGAKRLYLGFGWWQRWWLHMKWRWRWDMAAGLATHGDEDGWLPHLRLAGLGSEKPVRRMSKSHTLATLSMAAVYLKAGCPELLESEGFPQISLNLKIFLEFPWFWKKLLEFPWFWQISGFHALKKSTNGLSCCTYALKKSIPRLQEIAFSGLEISKFSGADPQTPTPKYPPWGPSMYTCECYCLMLEINDYWY